MSIPTMQRSAPEWRERLAELRHERAEAHDAMRQIINRAEAERRDLKPNEQQAFNRLEAKSSNLASEIDKADNEWRRAQENAPRREILPMMGGSAASVSRNETVTLAPEQRMLDWATARRSRDGYSPQDVEDFSLGNVMLGIVNPDYRRHLNDVEQRAMAEGTNTAGGFLTPEVLSSKVIDRIRNAMAVQRAGATTVPLESDTQSVPRLTTGVTGAWRTENSAFGETQPAFDRVTFTPQSYGFIVRISEELFQDLVPGAGVVLEREFAQAAALELDRAALRGTGTPPEPRGIRNQSGVTIQSLGANGATPTPANLMTSLTTLLSANREPDGLIYSPRSSQTFASLVDTTGQPLRLPEPLANLPKYVSAQVPNTLTQGTNSDTSEIYVGYWPDLLIGIRLGVQLRLLTERYADTGQYAWRVFMRLDVQVAHPESFVVVTGVRP